MWVWVHVCVCGCPREVGRRDMFSAVIICIMDFFVFFVLFSFCPLCLLSSI